MLPVEFRNAVADVVQAQGVRVPHRSSAISRKSVPIQVNDVDVDGAQSDALLEDARALIHESQDTAVDDFLRRDLALRNAGCGSPLAQNAGYFGIGNPVPVLVVLVPAGAGFLAITSHF